MRGCPRLLAAICVMLVAGCSTVGIKYPIGTTTGLAPDRMLFGTWRGHFADDKQGDSGSQKAEFYVHFVAMNNGKVIVVVVAAPRSGEEGGFIDAASITTATLGENHFINAVDLLGQGSSKSDEGTISPLLYTGSESGLTLCSLDLDETRNAIRSGAIAGTIEEHGAKDSIQHYETVTITADPAALDAFMAKPEAVKLFKPSMVLRKVD